VSARNAECGMRMRLRMTLRHLRRRPAPLPLPRSAPPLPTAGMDAAAAAALRVGRSRRALLCNRRSILSEPCRDALASFARPYRCYSKWLRRHFRVANTVVSVCASAARVLVLRLPFSKKQGAQARNFGGRGRPRLNV
jgi:hypothetical protein